MKIGIVGGTGDIGEGMALRLSQQHEVFLGSREEVKACEVSDRCVAALDVKGIPCRCTGTDNQGAVDSADIVVTAIPFQHVLVTLKSLTGFDRKIVISPVNPMQKIDHFVFAPPPEGSAAMMIQGLLPGAFVCAAFNNISSQKWKEIDHPLEYSVAVCGNDPGAKKGVMDLANGIPSLTAFDAGPLTTASMVESITPLLLNIARFNKMRDVGIRFL
ncbi:MAG: NADPH-dependent F420 reductase [Methanomicrobiales archaeon]|nr:NADPH-dependent F420 reductase [Methanomicrobiales archaeon]